MSALIEKLKAALEKASDEWDWQFSYAPRPGQQRIKILVQNIKQPEICKTVILTEELCKTLSVPDLSRHVMNLLSSVPKKNQLRAFSQPTPSRNAAPSPESLHEQYGTMRKSYAMKVSDLKEKAVTTPRPNLWLNLLGISLRNLQFVRK